MRLVNGARSSEWLPKGVFFVNSRTVEDGLWSIEAYDAMLKADITWTPRPGFSWPCSMEAAARDIALSMDVELDERNVYLPYTMDAYPDSEYMRRDALRDIAAAHGGMDLYAICPYATQEMALAVLLQVRDYQYQAFRADSANLDPAAELGDGVDVGGLYGAIAAITDNGDGYPDISAPGEEELEDEYPYRSETSRNLSSDVDSLRALIMKSLGGMEIELTSMKAEIQTLKKVVDAISDTVTQLESRPGKPAPESPRAHLEPDWIFWATTTPRTRCGLR